MIRTIKAADLFCGGGGFSRGLYEACKLMGWRLVLKAFNHNETAIKTHSANFPDAEHFCASLDNVNPRDHFEEDELDILLASPECTHHSVARGGRPINDQSRATAWCVIRWAETLRPKIIIVENVKEFRWWGPIGSNGRPLKSHKGEIFEQWKRTLEAIGYHVEIRVLCAADAGVPTTRERLFIMAVRRGRSKCVWPEPTHSRIQEADLFGQRKPWPSARQILDPVLKGRSIFNRKKSLAQKTLRRIFKGLFKYGLKPYLVPREGFYRGNQPRSVDDPVSTITASHGGGYLAQPYLVKLRNTTNAADINAPSPAVTAGGNHIGLAEPFLVNLKGMSTVRSVDEPAPTQTAGAHHLYLAEPFLVNTAHGNDAKASDDSRARSVDKAFPTVTCGHRGEWAVCEPFVLQQQSCGAPRSVSEPLPTVATSGAQSLISPIIVPIDNSSTASGVRSVDDPLSTVIAHDKRHVLAEPWLVKFYRTSRDVSVDEPLDSVTTRDRFGVAIAQLFNSPEITPAGTFEFDGQQFLMASVNGHKYLLLGIGDQIYLLEILFRMLCWNELAKAQGFPTDYIFVGNGEEKVRQIGNAVPCGLARAIILAVLTQDPTAPLRYFEMQEAA